MMHIRGSGFLKVHPEFPVEAFHGVAASLLLEPKASSGGTPAEDFSELWANDETRLEWIEVPMLDAAFVWVSSTKLEEVCDYLEEKLDATRRSTLVDRAQASDVGHDELVDLLYWVGYMADEPDPKLLDLFEAMFDDPRPTIRRAALNGFMIRRWPAGVSSVTRLAQTDDDPEVRATARRVLALDAGDA